MVPVSIALELQLFNSEKECKPLAEGGLTTKTAPYVQGMIGVCLFQHPLPRRQSCDKKTLQGDTIQDPGDTEQFMLWDDTRRCPSS